jgi:hypothetical protein
MAQLDDLAELLAAGGFVFGHEGSDRGGRRRVQDSKARLEGF